MERITNEQFMEAIKVVRAYQKQLQNDLDAANKTIKENSIYSEVTKDTSLEDIYLSPRLRNSLKMYFFKRNSKWSLSCPVSTLECVSESNFYVQRHVGHAVLKELKELCFVTGVKLMS